MSLPPPPLPSRAAMGARSQGKHWPASLSSGRGGRWLAVGGRFRGIAAATMRQEDQADQTSAVAMKVAMALEAAVATTEDVVAAVAAAAAEGLVRG